MKIKFIGLFALILAFSCKSQQETVKQESSQNLQSGTYLIENLNGKQTHNEKLELVVNLEDNAISGYTGCNSFSAHLTTNGNQIKIDRAMITLRHCEGAMETEKNILNGLRDAKSYTFTNQTLTLLDDEGKDLLKAKVMENTLKSGDYKLVSVEGESIDNSKASFHIDTENNAISGNTGCNTFGGELTTSKDNIDFGMMRVTKMYCDKGMELERKFMGSLRDTKKFSYQGNLLQLLSAEGKILITAELQ